MLSTNSSIISFDNSDLATPLTPCASLRRQAVALFHHGEHELAGPADALCTLRVAKLFRYTADINTIAILGRFYDSKETDVFDVVVDDGVHKDKLTLPSNRNRWVQRGLVRVGSVLKACRYALRHRDIGARQMQIFVLANAEVVEGEGEIERNHIENIPWLDPTTREYHPLATHRSCYLDLHNSDTFYTEDPRWANVRSEMLLNKPPSLSPTHPLLRPLLSVHGNLLVSPSRSLSILPLIGRVVSKTRAHHFGRLEDTRQRLPFQLSLDVVDESCGVRVVCWNERALRAHAGIRVGDVVVVEGYWIKRKYGERWDEMEVSVNEFGPVGVIKVLRNAHLAVFPDHYTRFPSPPLVLLPRVYYDRTPDNFEFDLAGTVVYVGDVLLERGKGRSISQLRWLKLLDTSTSKEILFKMYTCGQPASFHSIRPGQALFCRRVRLHSIRLDSGLEKTVYVATTRMSWLVIGEVTERQEEVPEEAWRLVKSVDPSEFFEAGYFNLPVPFSTVKQWKDFHPDFKLANIYQLHPPLISPTSSFTLNPPTINDLTHLASTLHLHEQLKVGVLATITRVCLGVESWGRDIEGLRRVLDEWSPGDAVVKVASVTEGAVVQAAVMPNAAEPGAAGRWSRRKEEWTMRTFLDMFRAEGVEGSGDSQVEQDEDILQLVAERAVSIVNRPMVVILDIKRDSPHTVRAVVSKVLWME